MGEEEKKSGIMTRIDIAGKTPEEMFELAKEEGMEIPDEALEQVAGGLSWGGKSYYVSCPFCGWNATLSEEEYGNGTIICKGAGCGATLSYR